MDGGRAQNLREAAGDRKNVNVYEGDCNSILLKDVFPKVRYSDYRRALCLLDPYGLNLQWEVMKTAGQEKSIEIFLNFMVMDMNMNVLLRDTSKVRDDQLARMNGFWGDESWREAAYTKKPTLFGSIDEKTNNDALAQAFRKRLKDVAGFAYVPDPLPMKNSLGRTVYYLYFASPNNTGAKIVTDIFNSYRDKGGK
jgi:three-Cys-motif partner protein